MRRIILPIILALSAILASCSTSVSVDYLSPSEIDMGRYRNVAVASTVAFKGFHNPPAYVRAGDSGSLSALVPSSYTGSLAQDVASYATGSLVSSLRKTGFFNVLEPSITDPLVAKSRYGLSIADEVEALGIDAFIVPRIVSMDVNEFITSEREFIFDYSHLDDEGRPKRIMVVDYKLNQVVSLVYSYTVIDARTMTIYATKTFSDKREFVEDVSMPFLRGTNPYAYFRWMLDDMTSLAAVQLAPRHSSVSLTLMENKPKAEAVEDAYKLAGDGYISQACILFTQEWERSGHLPSGYNAALLTAASGDLDGAIAILEEISSSYDSAEVDSLLSGLRDLRSRDSQARQQLSGEGPVTNYTDSDTSIFSVVMGV